MPTSGVTVIGRKPVPRPVIGSMLDVKSAAKLGNSGLAHLPVKNLIYLNLEGTGVTGDGIASLCEAQHLQFLTLSGESLVETRRWPEGV